MSTESKAAPTSAAAVAEDIRPRLRPTSATTTGKVSVVACSRPAAAAGLPPSLRRKSTAGAPLTIRMPASRAGIRAREDALAKSDFTSNWMPVPTKNTGTRNPYPIACSLL
jgi:hypothetical protein